MKRKLLPRFGIHAQSIDGSVLQGSFVDTVEKGKEFFYSVTAPSPGDIHPLHMGSMYNNGHTIAAGMSAVVDLDEGEILVSERTPGLVIDNVLGGVHDNVVCSGIVVQDFSGPKTKFVKMLPLPHLVDQIPTHLTLCKLDWEPIPMGTKIRYYYPSGKIVIEDQLITMEDTRFYDVMKPRPWYNGRFSRDVKVGDTILFGDGNYVKAIQDIKAGRFVGVERDTGRVWRIFSAGRITT